LKDNLPEIPTPPATCKAPLDVEVDAVVFVIAILTEIFFLFKHYKTLDFKMIMNGVLLLVNAFLAYMVNRLLYTMCVKSL
jgi:hypothetical protein